MATPTHVFRFSDIKDGLCQADFINCKTNEIHEIKASIDDSRLLHMSAQLFSSPLADLIDLALAVHVADRLAKRRGDARRVLHIELPVRHPEIFAVTKVLHTLEDALFSFTYDHWTFNFVQRKAAGRSAEQQLRIPFYSNSESSTEVALWSGGLDSLAGLYRRVNEPNSAARYVLFGTGGNPIVHNVQARVYAKARDTFLRKTRSAVDLTQALIRLSDTKQLGKKNPVPRARGFVFILLGSVCAAFEGQHRLMIYENGIGAINLRYRSSEVSVDHSRAVHPASLEKMSTLLTLILDERFAVYNPFLFLTKAQLCAALVRSDINDLVDLTLSCDRRRRDKATQCGSCTSCLLRRQALASLQYVEPPKAYFSISRSLHGRSAGPRAYIPLRAMLTQVGRLNAAIASATPWVSMAAAFPDLVTVADVIAREEGLSPAPAQGRLIALYNDYVAEWRGVQHIVGSELLHGAPLRAA